MTFYTKNSEKQINLNYIPPPTTANKDKVYIVVIIEKR